jgi:hypothetical protein
MHFVSEVPYALSLTLACAFSARSLTTPSYLADAVAGAAAGLAALTRPQILAIVPLVIVGAVVCRSTARKHLAFQLCVLALVLSPWLLRNWMVIGKPTLSTVGAYTFWGAHNNKVFEDTQLQGSWIRTSDLVDADHPLGDTELQKEQQMWRYGLEAISEHLRLLPWIELRKLWRLVSPFEDTPNRVVFWLFAVSWAAIAPLLFLGVVRSRGELEPPLRVTLMLPLVATVLTTAVFYGSIRFRDSVAPLVVVLASNPLCSLVAMILSRPALLPVNVPSPSRMRLN